jgi:hypothetical protein
MTGLAVFLLAGCDAIRTVNVEVVSETTVQSGGPLGGVFSGLGFSEFASFDVSNSTTFQNNNASRDNIGESYVTQFVLEVTDPDNQTLSFIDELEVYVGDGNNRTRVAYLGDDQSTDVSELRLQVYDEREIGQYLRAEETVVDVEATGSPPDEDTTIEATMGFAIELEF